MTKYIFVDVYIRLSQVYRGECVNKNITIDITIGLKKDRNK